MHPSIHQSINHSINPSIHPAIYPWSIHPPIHSLLPLSIPLFIAPSIHPFNPSINHSTHPLVRSFLHSSVRSIFCSFVPVRTDIWPIGWLRGRPAIMWDAPLTLSITLLAQLVVENSASGFENLFSKECANGNQVRDRKAHTLSPHSFHSSHFAPHLIRIPRFNIIHATSLLTILPITVTIGPFVVFPVDFFSSVIERKLQSQQLTRIRPLIESKLIDLRDLFPISSDQFSKLLKTSLFVSEDTDPGR